MSHSPANFFRRRPDAMICLVLGLGTLALYWPVAGYPFINFDDNDYITNNPMVKAGLTWQGMIWAFNGAHAANWHPLTWLSLMLDCQIFGVRAGGFHLVNVLFHIANTLLLFVFLNDTTGAIRRSAFVAALFAWHPLHVESVVWISERKDVLSAFFWLLTMLMYARYTRSVGGDAAAIPSCVTRCASRDYALALIFCACAMLSKPMAVTLPFALILLDVWPLGRFPISDFRFPILKKLLLEKIPFFVLSAAACALTWFAQRGGGAVSPVGWTSRIENVPVAYVRYLSKLFWPADLAIVYPYVYHWPMSAIVGTALLLLLLSVLAVVFIRQRSWPAVGWFWFLGTLVPAIGLVQVGAQSMADRYAYIPSIGLFIVVVWGATELCAVRPNGNFILSLLTGCALLGCTLATSLQITYWRSSENLFLHALRVTANNYVAENALGKVLENSGHYEQALALYQNAVKIQPRYAVSQFNLGILLVSLGRMAEALPHLVAAAKLSPNDADAQFNLGMFYLHAEKWPDAAQCFEAALKLQPNFATGHFRLGQTLVHLEKFPEAAVQFRQALRLQPGDANAQKALDALLASHLELK